MNGGPPNAWRGASTPPPVTPTLQPGGGDSTRFRRRSKGRKWRYWWEEDEPTAVLVLPPEEAVLAPVTVEALWAEKADLGVYIGEAAAEHASKAVLAKLAEVDAFISKRISEVMQNDAKRLRRIKKKRMLLLGH